MIECLGRLEDTEAVLRPSGRFRCAHLRVIGPDLVAMLLYRQLVNDVSAVNNLSQIYVRVKRTKWCVPSGARHVCRCNPRFSLYCVSLHVLPACCAPRVGGCCRMYFECEMLSNTRGKGSSTDRFQMMSKPTSLGCYAANVQESMNESLAWAGLLSKQYEGSDISARKKTLFSPYSARLPLSDCVYHMPQLPSHEISHANGAAYSVRIPRPELVSHSCLRPGTLGLCPTHPFPWNATAGGTTTFSCRVRSSITRFSAILSCPAHLRHRALG